MYLKIFRIKLVQKYVNFIMDLGVETKSEVGFPSKFFIFHKPIDVPSMSVPLLESKMLMLEIDLTEWFRQFHDYDHCVVVSVKFIYSVG